MKKLVYLSLLVLVAISGCSSDSDTPSDPVVTEKPLVSGTIGSDGGKLENDEVILQLPAGTLAGDAEVKVYLESEQDPFGDELASRVLRLEGLPDTFTSPITIKLAHGADNPDSLFALLGGESWIPSLQESQVTWMMEDCRDSLGWAIFELQPLTGSAGKADTSTPVYVTTVKGISHLDTSDGHFRIYWSPSEATTAQITGLRSDIEEAMGLYDSMGFEQEGFDDWPIKVQVKSLNWFGHWDPNPRKLGGELAFSTKYIHDDVEIRLTAGHELLHFCQYFYDPRSVWDRGAEADPYSWLMEATAVYIEDYFAPNAEYCSAARRGRELTALDGIINPQGRTLAEHGYGQSSIIRYLAETEGDAFILRTFADISQGANAVIALQNQTETDIQDVWQDILEELVLGNIYTDVTLPVLLKYGVYSIQTINSAADSVGTHALDYPDLSGQPYYIRWNESYDFNSNQWLEFWCDAPEYGLSVFGLKEPDTRVLLGSAYGKVKVANLPIVQEGYDIIMAMVSNHHLAGPDYLGATGITIQSRLKEVENIGRYDHAKILIRYEATWSTSSSNTYAQDMTFVEVPGSFSGTTFSASWDSTDANSGVHNFGHLNVSLDPATLKVTSWSAQNGADDEEGWSKDFQASGSGLPDVSYNTSSLDGLVEDEATCDSIGGLSVVFLDNEGDPTRTLDGYTCNPSSFVKVFLYNRDPD